VLDCPWRSEEEDGAGFYIRLPPSSLLQFTHSIHLPPGTLIGGWCERISRRLQFGQVRTYSHCDAVWQEGVEGVGCPVQLVALAKLKPCILLYSL